MPRPPIRFEDISVVVQGPWKPDLTPPAMDSLRRLMPGAEVIVSTWKGTDPALFGDGVARVLLNDDPGPIDHRRFADPVFAKDFHTQNNVNRQIVSAHAGARAATRPYCLKMRTDTVIHALNFLDHFAAYPARAAGHRLLCERLVVTNAFSPRRGVCFAVGDHFQFGLTEDVRTVWDIPLSPGDAELAALPEEERNAVYTLPERYITQAFVRKFLDLPALHHGERPDALVELAERVIADNFVCLDYYDYGIKLESWNEGLSTEEASRREKVWRMFTISGIYTCLFAEWLHWYERWCGGSAADAPGGLGEVCAPGREDVRVADAITRTDTDDYMRAPHTPMLLCRIDLEAGIGEIGRLARAGDLERARRLITLLLEYDPANRDRLIARGIMRPGR
ncbi:MAG TPA: WavE lipopolysaccharide synthesis family protein [Azospirillum sp.]|nr:WavE lipopolysaccharide synthesis family protein [Azospirillum sp.]